MEVYEPGKVKVVWIGDRSDTIKSRMFETEEEADRFGQEKGDFIVFRLVQQEEMKTFTWEVLPYGQHRLYQKIVDFYKRHHDKEALFQLVEKVL
jgi:hypothetical protein